MTKSTKTATKTAIKKPTKSLEVLSTAINKAVNSQATATFDIGNNLLHAKGHFLKESGVVDAKKWLEWVFVNFSIKKAQANNYVKIVQVFSTKKEFKGLSTQVLANLMRDEKMVSEASKLLKAGKEITNKWTVEYKKAKDDACEVKKAKRELDAKNAQILLDAELAEEKKNAPIKISKDMLAKAKANVEIIKAQKILIEALKKELADAKQSNNKTKPVAKKVAKPVAKKVTHTQTEVNEIKIAVDLAVDTMNKIQLKDKSLFTKNGQWKKKALQATRKAMNAETVAHLKSKELTVRYQAVSSYLV